MTMIDETKEHSDDLKKTRKPIITIVSIILVISIIISSFLIITNWYGNKIDYEDINYSYVIYGNKIQIKIIPLTNIKNFSFKLCFSHQQQKYYEEIKIKKALENQSILYTYSIEEISKKINYNTPTSVSLILEQEPGLKQIKANKNNYKKIEYDMCNFYFEVDYYERIGSDEYKITTYITNNTTKKIASIQNFHVDALFKNDISCDFYSKRYDFDTPLAPNETRKIDMEYTIKIFGVGTTEKGNEFRKTTQKSIGYEDISYDLVYINN